MNNALPADETSIAERELARLRALLRQIACNTDPTWGRQLARDEVGEDAALLRRLPKNVRPMVAWEGYIDVENKTGLACYGHRNIRVNQIGRHHLMPGQRCARVRVVEVPG